VSKDPERTSCYDVLEDNKNVRLDAFLFSQTTDLSRSRIQSLIKNGHVKVNDRQSKPSYRLKPGDQVLLALPPAPAAPFLDPGAVEFQVIHEDGFVLVLNKPPGVVVHPAPGHDTGTLVHGLLRHGSDLSHIGGELRPGIVHRLDKDTSGLMVVAKTNTAHAFLSRQFKSGTVKKVYAALVHGTLRPKTGLINRPIARHPKKRKSMTVVASGGRSALTQWERVREFGSGFSLLSVSLKTGRTHQIRVHLSHEGHPVVGDPLYGLGRNWWKRHPLVIKGLLPPVTRQMLHARRLGFVHPGQETYLEFEAPLPDDMAHVLSALKALDS
jgi:23S rRNA pseudouridine1911/1915/1917 synthase